MIVTYVSSRNRYVDSGGRLATVNEYGKDFYNCSHDFQDTGRRGTTIGGNGKHVQAAAYKCSGCGVYTVVELGSTKQ